MVIGIWFDVFYFCFLLKRASRFYVGAQAWLNRLYQVTGVGKYKANGLTVCCEL